MPHKAQISLTSPLRATQSVALGDDHGQETSRNRSLHNPTAGQLQIAIVLGALYTAVTKHDIVIFSDPDKNFRAIPMRAESTLLRIH
jgi:hypothetical protein